MDIQYTAWIVCTIKGNMSSSFYTLVRYKSYTIVSIIRELKDKNLNYSLKWDFIETAETFNPITKKCRLCLKEKFHIMYNRPSSSLNKRQEIFNTCRHRKQRLLENFKPWGPFFCLFSFMYRRIFNYASLWKLCLSLMIVTVSYMKQICRIKFSH